MRIPVGVMGLVVCLVLGLSGGAALAQQVLQSSFKVGFAFRVANVEYPAGSYQLSYRSGDRFLTLRNTGTGDSAMLSFVTRLSSREKGGIVFDKAKEGTRRLTEIYLGDSDGFLLEAGQDDQQHERIDLKP